MFSRPTSNPRAIDRTRIQARGARMLGACALFAAGCVGPTPGAPSGEGGASPGYYGREYEQAPEGADYSYPLDPSAYAQSPQPEALPDAAVLRAMIGTEGGELVGEPGTPFADLRLVIPAGALATPTTIEIARTDSNSPLPVAAVRCGPMFSLMPAGLELAAPATLTLPVDRSVVSEQSRFDDEVKVWMAEGDTWTQRLQVESEPGRVTVEITTLSYVAAGVNPPADADIVRFALRPNPEFVDCLARFPGDARRQPIAEVAVVRGEQNDSLFLRARNLLPGLEFSLFTIERSQLNARGALDRRFSDFGLALYQSDFEADDRGVAQTSIRGILLDQGFVFDEDNLDPTSLFHVGFWFDAPEDAAACGFDAQLPTAFNEQHEAGPMAMISLPDRVSGLGPLCTNPDTSGEVARCVIPED